MKLPAALLAATTLLACERPPPPPELLVGGPYLGEQLLAQPGPFLQQRAKERTSIPRGSVPHFHLLLRAVFDRTVKMQIVNAAGTVCHELVDKIANPAYKTNPHGYGARGIPVPNGTSEPTRSPSGTNTSASSCKEGAFPAESLVPGRYTAKFWIDDKRVTERVFDVEP